VRIVPSCIQLFYIVVNYAPNMVQAWSGLGISQRDRGRVLHSYRNQGEVLVTLAAFVAGCAPMASPTLASRADLISALAHST